MRRLMVLCICGERIQVPRSALGRTGLCPACGRSISITADTATPMKEQPYAQPAPVSGARRPGGGRGSGNGMHPSAEAKQRFAEGVDLYFAQQFARALNVFQTLAEEFPGNRDIETALAMCITALQNRAHTALPYSESHLLPPASGDTAAAESPPGEAPGSRRKGRDLRKLDVTALKTVLLDKLVNGATDEIQLRAAELAVKVIDIEGRKHKSLKDVGEIEAVLREGLELQNGDAAGSSDAPPQS